MRTFFSKEDYQRIYELMNRSDVVEYDCGTLCGAACCTAALDGMEEEMGIYLLPGEEQLHLDDQDWMDLTVSRAEDHDLPESWDGDVYFVHCKTPPICPRDKRPIQCRTFPLAPHIDEDGELIMIYNDLELPYTCPLIEEEIPLNDEYVDRKRIAITALASCLLFFVLTGCGKKQPEQSVITFDKEGHILEYLVEDFPASQYDETEWDYLDDDEFYERTKDWNIPYDGEDWGC